MRTLKGLIMCVDVFTFWIWVSVCCALFGYSKTKDIEDKFYDWLVD